MTSTSQTLKVIKAHDDGIFKKLPRILPKVSMVENQKLPNPNILTDSESVIQFNFKPYYST